MVTSCILCLVHEKSAKTLVKIPLEQFEDVLKYVNKNIEEKHLLQQLQKEQEYALNLATKKVAVKFQTWF